MFFPGVEMQMRSALEMMLAQEGANVVTAKLHWRVVTRPEGYDPNDEDTAAGGVVETPEPLEFRTFFHQVDHRLSGWSQFREVVTGDVILDYLADLDLAGKSDVRVEVGGLFYVQKTASTGLLEAWDVAMEGGGMLKSILLTPAG